MADKEKDLESFREPNPTTARFKITCTVCGQKIPMAEFAGHKCPKLKGK